MSDSSHLPTIPCPSDRDPEEQALLLAIRAHPNDDTPRLIYADWLQERAAGGDGDPNYDWAQFIRLQCEMARAEARDGPGSWAVYNLHTRQEKLSIAHNHRWTRPIKSLGVDTVHAFQRGLPESVAITVPTFLEHGDELFAAGPTLTAAQILYDNAEELVALADCPHLRHLRSLTLIGTGLTPESLRALVSSPHLASLEEIDLGYRCLPSEAAEVLAHETVLPSLTRLDLGRPAFDADELRTLAASRRFPRVTELKIETTDAGVLQFLDSPHFPDLERVIDPWDKRAAIRAETGRPPGDGHRR